MGIASFGLFELRIILVFPVFFLAAGFSPYLIVHIPFPIIIQEIARYSNPASCQDQQQDHK